MKIRFRGYNVIHCAHSRCFMNWLNQLLQAGTELNHSRQRARQARQVLIKTFALRSIQIVYSAHCLHHVTKILCIFK